MRIKSWLKKIWLAGVKNVYGLLGYGTLKCVFFKKG